jgi:hypothetical protein
VVALGAGSAVLLLVAAAGALAWPDASPLEPGRGGRLTGDPDYAWAFLGLLAAAFVAYLFGLRALAGRAPRTTAVVVLAVAVQLVPLGAPLLLSSDAYTYWAYGDIARVHGNPYSEPPSDFPEVPGYEWMGDDWVDQTTVYGPVFTLASAGVDGSRPEYAAWAFKLLAALSMAAIVVVAARRSAFAAAFVGWNPLLALHLAGGGHNDALMGALLVAALALGEAGRRHAAGAAWVLAVAVKWIPLALFPLRVLEARATGRRVGHLGFALTAAAVVGLATWQFGFAWLRAFVPLAENVERTTSSSLPHRLSQLGVPEGAAIALFALVFAAAYVWLVRTALAGRARLALAAGLLVACSPYVTPWYLAWVVPLAALEDDRAARVLALALTAYLLPATVPV